jgi:ABC-type protease/lipase transport system fused ATPase/permease subunit
MGGNAPVREFFVRFRSYFIYAAFFSLVINLLMLVPALFMLQVFDRVVSSRSQETLLMLAVLAAGALLFMAYLDVIRFGALGRLYVSRVAAAQEAPVNEETALPLVQQFLSRRRPAEAVAPPRQRALCHCILNRAVVVFIKRGHRQRNRGKQ